MEKKDDKVDNKTAYKEAKGIKESEREISR